MEGEYWLFRDSREIPYETSNEENTAQDNWSDDGCRVPWIRDSAPGDTNEEQGET